MLLTGNECGAETDIGTPTAAAVVELLLKVTVWVRDWVVVLVMVLVRSVDEATAGMPTVETWEAVDWMVMVSSGVTMATGVIAVEEVQLLQDTVIVLTMVGIAEVDVATGATTVETELDVLHGRVTVA